MTEVLATKMRGLLHGDFERTKARVHGNGFAQFETRYGGKVHVWEHNTPRQTLPTMIHDHNHGFGSTIIHGTLQNIEYELAEDEAGYWEMLQARPRHEKDTELVPAYPGKRFRFAKSRVWTLTEGSVYELPPGIFHESKPVTMTVVTHVQRMGERWNTEPFILCPIGAEPDNDFNRYAHEDYCRDLHRRLLTGVVL